MSDNKFKVPAKSAPTKRGSSSKNNTQTEEKVKKTTTPKKSTSTPKKKSEGEVKKKVNSTQEKKEITSKKAKVNLIFDKQELPKNNPSLANMTREERLAYLNPKDVKKNVEKPKEEKGKETRSEITSLMESVKKNTPKKEENVQKEVSLPVKKEKSNTLIYLVILLIIILLILTIALLVKKRINKPKQIENGNIYLATNEDLSVKLTIKSGMSASQVASILPSFLQKDLFLTYVNQNNLASSIRTGEYLINSTFNEEEVAKLITTKKVNDSVLIYPGYTLNDIDLALSNRDLIKAGEFLKAAESFSKANGLSFSEGYFLSGEYKFISSIDLLEEMNNALFEILKNYPEQVVNSGLSVDEIVKIASIINRETQDNTQMSDIAAIILNRYRQNMPLGIDATTRYELNNWSDVISQSIYEKDTPYNTRRKAGLPPTGIGCPSEEAILAVLFPSKISDLYYLHDKEGKLYTSQSYEEHLKTYEKVHSL